MHDRKRSRSYPGAALADCLGYVRTVSSKLGSGAHSREDISAAIGSPKVTGGSARKIAAMGMFGLLAKTPEGYSLTQLAKSLMRPLDGEEPKLMKEAFFSVDLYREVLEACDERLPDQLAVILERKHGISHGIGDYAARILKESAISAGVIDYEGNVRTGTHDEDVAAAGSTPEDPSRVEEPLQPMVTLPQGTEPPRPDLIRLELPKPAVVFTAPRSLTAREVKRVEEWIDRVLKPQFSFLVEETEDHDDR